MKRIIKENRGEGKGCLMLQLQVNNWDDILSKIDPEDIAEEGLEDDPHITILFGFDPEVKADRVLDFVEKILQDSYIKKLDVRVEDVSLFENDDDVLKYDIHCPTLNLLNLLVRNEFPYENKYPEYVPHATIGYLKSGKGQKYVEGDIPKELEVTGYKLVYSDKDKKKSYRGMDTNVSISESMKLFEGAWGHYPLDNDSASDWKWEFGDVIISMISTKIKDSLSLEQQFDLDYLYYSIGIWEFFREKMKTQYSFFTDDEVYYMDMLCRDAALQLLDGDYAERYEKPHMVTDYLENFINVVEERNEYVDEDIKTKYIEEFGEEPVLENRDGQYYYRLRITDDKLRKEFKSRKFKKIGGPQESEPNLEELTFYRPHDIVGWIMRLHDHLPYIPLEDIEVVENVNGKEVDSQKADDVLKHFLQNNMLGGVSKSNISRIKHIIGEDLDIKELPTLQVFFESKDSYKPPKSAQNNAKQVLKWKEEYGDEVEGMTQTGWTRARQLASGEKVSRDVVGRMASFARHKKNSKVDPEHEVEPWKDAGRVAWLGWGGDTGIEWAQKIVDRDEN